MVKRYLLVSLPVVVVVTLLLLRPTEYHDRLADIPESASLIDNDQYFTKEVMAQWWGAASTDVSGMGLLHLLNPARVPYFDRYWKKVLNLDDKRSFLDVGCGGGIATEALAKLGYNITGVDLSDNSLTAAREHARLAGITNVRYLKASAYDLPFEKESFDGIVSSDVLEHIHNLRRMIAEIARVLKPGGVFVFDTINRSWQSWLVSIIGAQELFGFLPSNTHDWRLFITPEELTKLMKEFNLIVDESAYIGMRPSFHPMKIFKGLLPGFLGDFVETWDMSNNYLGYAVKAAS